MRPIATAGWLLATSLVLSCSTQLPHLSKTAYLQKSEQICADLERQGQGLPNPASPHDLPAYLAASTRLTVAAKAKLDALATRSSDKAYLYRIFLTPMGAQIAAVERIKRKVAQDSARGSTATLDGLQLPQADLAAMGIYGFHECRKVVGSR